jgi:putative nucleotidyltransferase with HDIG domain
LRVLQALQDPERDANAVQQVVANDPAISAKLLRVANSPVFALSQRVVTIAEAVRLLGYANVHGMLLGVGAFALFRSEQINLKAFWRHSIATALGARMLAPKVGCPPEEAFAAGLLHDIGKLVLAVQEETGYQRALDLEREAKLTGLEAEHAMFEFTHPEVGQTMAERWNLPGRYVRAIAHHHEPRSADDETIFCALIGLADEAAHAALPSSPAVPVREANRQGLQAVLGLTETDWEECVAQLAQAQFAVDAFVGAL